MTAESPSYAQTSVYVDGMGVGAGQPPAVAPRERGKGPVGPESGDKHKAISPTVLAKGDSWCLFFEGTFIHVIISLRCVSPTGL